jgi:hypothetical protein
MDDAAGCIRQYVCSLDISISAVIMRDTYLEWLENLYIPKFGYHIISVAVDHADSSGKRVFLRFGGCGIRSKWTCEYGIEARALHVSHRPFNME